MLNKNECEKALQMLDYPTKEWDIIEQLVKEHFELVEEYKKVQLEAQRYFDNLCEGGWHDKEYQEFKNPQPYKFEDLKEDMWYWDNVFKEVCYISSIINKERMYVEYLESHCSIEPHRIMYFEENRFFPVQMANREVKE